MFKADLKLAIVLLLAVIMLLGACAKNKRTIDRLHRLVLFFS